MSVNVQRDGRPAEYRWRSLFNAAKLLTPTTRMPCSNAAKTRNPLKLAGGPKLTKRSQPLVGRSSPYCKDTWGDIVSDCRYVPYLRRHSPTKLCDGACRWRFFGDVLRPVFSASHVQHVSDLRLKFALRPHHVWKYMEYIQSATAEIRRGKKEEERYRR